MKGSVVSKLPFILLLLAVVVIAAATFVESAYGTTFAHQTMYGAWWFVALWGLIAIAGCRVMYKKKLWKRPSLFVLHLSFLLILAGALTTHISSRSGMTHLREGEATCTFWMKNEQGAYIKPATLPFYLALHDFRILYDADKLDAVGVMGIARSLIGIGNYNNPMYEIVNNKINADENSDKDTFIRYYMSHIAKNYDRFFTAKAKDLAEQMKTIDSQYIQEFIKTVNNNYAYSELLKQKLN